MPHIDLLKFEDEVLGISLGAAEMVFRRIKPEMLPVQPGGDRKMRKHVDSSDVSSGFSGQECRVDCEDRHLKIGLQPGDVYGMRGAARYEWSHEIMPVKARRISRETQHRSIYQLKPRISFIHIINNTRVYSILH